MDKAKFQFIRSDGIAHDLVFVADGEHIELGSILETGEMPKSFTYTGRLTNSGIKSLRKLFMQKLPRKLKKKLHGTRRNRKRAIHKMFIDAAKQYETFLKNSNG